ncbi:MAG TPA: DASS family sodium-coupled anion symporter [Pyrinomonadaceae bacterium]|nr:DASS family sodium-coupled anion symporter [Pyrinomonadaceae bacterium]
MQSKLVKWVVVIGSGVVVAALPRPEGITSGSWTLFAIFIATIVGSIVQPLTGSAMVLLGVVATAVTGTLDAKTALRGYSEPVVWLVLAAFFLSCGVIKTGLGRRIALLFIKAIGRDTFGLGYALIATDFVLASVVPSNGARNGGIMIPIAVSVSESYDSRPDDGTANKLGAYLMNLLYQCDVIIGATFITGQAGNFVIAKLVKDNTGIELSYAGWFAAAIVPALISLAIVPAVIYRLFPPEISQTPGAADFARNELEKSGPITDAEKIVIGTLIAVIFFWITKDTLHTVDTAIVALVGIGVMLLTGVITWSDIMGERNAWSTFIWYGGLVNMATAAGETGLTKVFADRVGGMTSGMTWAVALAIIALVYFYSHYFFASITAHVLAMLVPFLVVTMAAGAPVGLSVLVLIYFSNLNASLTHFGTTPGPIYFGTGYVKQGVWWKTGLITSIINISVWSVAGLLWWKLLGWW